MNLKQLTFNRICKQYILIICMLTSITYAHSYLTSNYQPDRVQHAIAGDRLHAIAGDRLLSIVLINANIMTDSISNLTNSTNSSDSFTNSTNRSDSFTNSTNRSDSFTTSNLTSTEVFNLTQTQNQNITPITALNNSTIPEISIANSSNNSAASNISSTSSGNISSTSSEQTASIITIQKYPNELDYSSQGYLSSDNKTMSYCNSSWAIASAYLYQSKLISIGVNTIISEQSIIACTTYYSSLPITSTCSAGNFQDALNFLALVGSVNKANYPNTSLNVASVLAQKTPICTDKNRIYIGPGNVVVMRNVSDDQIKQILDTHGPILADVYADSNFKNYQKDTFSACPANSSSQTNLSVMIFGYKGSDYWLIRTPFGQGWGFMGSMKLSMSNNCGLSSHIGYIDYNQTSINSNVNQVFDPTAKYSKKYQSTSTLFERYLLYFGTLLFFLLML